MKQFVVILVVVALGAAVVKGAVAVYNFLAPHDEWHCVGNVISGETGKPLQPFDAVLKVGRERTTMNVATLDGVAVGMELDSVQAKDDGLIWGWGPRDGRRSIWRLYRATNALEILPYEEGKFARVKAACTHRPPN